MPAPRLPPCGRTALTLEIRLVSWLSRRRGAAVAFTILVGACGFEPDGERPFDPPPVYREWHARTQLCSGVRGDFERIRWFVIEGDGFDCPSGRCAGRWQNEHDIYIASEYLLNEMVVSHEMLHDLLGKPGHPDPPFGDPCPLTWDTWIQGDGPTQGRSIRMGLD